MNKGQFAPGKRVLLLNCEPEYETKPELAYLIGTEQTLEVLVPAHEVGDGKSHLTYWLLRGVVYPTPEFDRVAWPQRYMFLLDPDETPEQSAEAMRKLHEITTPKKAIV